MLLSSLQKSQLRNVFGVAKLINTYKKFENCVMLGEFLASKTY